MYKNAAQKYKTIIRLKMFVSNVLLRALLALAFFSKGLALSPDFKWYEDANIYEVYIRSFQDSDGDGVGDLGGIIQRLEYLKELGITAIWITPMYESPMIDMGYDIKNFTNIDPLFGTLDIYDKLYAKAKSMGIKIILDMVPNHTSDQHPWFQKSIERQPGYEDYYIWDDGLKDPRNSSNRLPPNNWLPDIGESSSAWTWVEERQQFYLHQFLPEQPDLNFSNPIVRAEIIDVFKFWMDRGVDGFRLDSIIFLYDYQNPDGTWPDASENKQVENFKSLELVYEWRQFVDEYQTQLGGDEVVFLSEAYTYAEFHKQTFSNGTHKGSQIIFNFDLVRTTDKSPGEPADLNIRSTAEDFKYHIDRWMNNFWEHMNYTANWQINNHDNPRATTRIGEEKKDLLNMLITSLPGISVTYYVSSKDRLFRK